MATRIWYRDPVGAFDRDSAHRFFPQRTMSLTQQLNAVFRLALYYSLIMVLLTRRSAHLTAVLVAALATAALHELSTREHFWSDAPARCVAPSKGNPFMNVTVADLERRPARGPACSPLAPATAAVVNTLSERPLTDGPYEEHGSRFYTMPVTTAVNDQEGFAKALYGGRQSNALGARA